MTSFRDLSRVSRRRALHVLAAAPLCAACGGAPNGSPVAVGDVPAGSIDTLSVGSVRAVPGYAVCICRDSGGVYSMTLTCTHAGCNMAQVGSVGPQGLYCGCHGSRFDTNGNVLRGPARTPLQHYAVSADSAGNLTIHGDQYVAADVRLAV